MTTQEIVTRNLSDNSNIIQTDYWIMGDDPSNIEKTFERQLKYYTCRYVYTLGNDPGQFPSGDDLIIP